MKMDTFFFENSAALRYIPSWEKDPPDEKGEVSAEGICEAAAAAFMQQFPEAEEAPEVEERANCVYCGPIKVMRDQTMERLRRKFGHFGFYSLLDDPFEEGTRCQCCAEEATERVEANVWGTIYQFDACAEHAEQYDGKRTDRVPSFEEGRA